MKNSKIISNKPDGLSISLIIILILIIITCILWYVYYKKPIVKESFIKTVDVPLKNTSVIIQPTESDLDTIQEYGQVYVNKDIIEGSLMTPEEFNSYFGPAKKKRH
jgi:hypothetical protein